MLAMAARGWLRKTAMGYVVDNDGGQIVSGPSHELASVVRWATKLGMVIELADDFELRLVAAQRRIRSLEHDVAAAAKREAAANARSLELSDENAELLTTTFELSEIIRKAALIVADDDKWGETRPADASN